MLAGRLRTLADVRYPVLCTPKLDGIRCLVVAGRALTRSFKLVPNRCIAAAIAQLPEGCDGEIVTADFSTTQSDVMSRDGNPAFAYCVFDIASELPYERRCESVAELQTPFVRHVLPQLCSTEADLLAYEAEQLHLGYEGVCLRSPGSPYKFGRSGVKEGWLLKWKRQLDGEARIIGFEESMQNLNPVVPNVFGYARRPGGGPKLPKGTLGSLLVQDIATGMRFSVGNGKGLDDALRAAVWAAKDAFLGRVIRYKYQELGSKGRPRFPQFDGFREVL
jgi:DNA ligase-1